MEQSKLVSCQYKSVDLTPQDIFIVGFTDGTIRIYKYPVLHERAEYIEIQAHRGSVVSVCITENNQYLVSAGQEDSSISVWEIIPSNSEEGPFYGAFTGDETDSHN